MILSPDHRESPHVLIYPCIQVFKRKKKIRSRWTSSSTSVWIMGKEGQMDFLYLWNDWPEMLRHRCVVMRDFLAVPGWALSLRSVFLICEMGVKGWMSQFSPFRSCPLGLCGRNHGSTQNGTGWVLNVLHVASYVRPFLILTAAQKMGSRERQSGCKVYTLALCYGALW